MHNCAKSSIMKDVFDLKVPIVTLKNTLVVVTVVLEGGKKLWEKYMLVKMKH